MRTECLHGMTNSTSEQLAPSSFHLSTGVLTASQDLYRRNYELPFLFTIYLQFMCMNISFDLSSLFSTRTL